MARIWLFVHYIIKKEVLKSAALRWLWLTIAWGSRKWNFVIGMVPTRLTPSLDDHLILLDVPPRKWLDPHVGIDSGPVQGLIPLQKNPCRFWMILITKWFACQSTVGCCPFSHDGFRPLQVASAIFVGPLPYLLWVTWFLLTMMHSCLLQ